MSEYDIAKYERFLDKHPRLESHEHWAKAKKVTFTLFNVLIDNDLTELVFVLEHFPHYTPLVCEHFRYSYSYSEKEADISAASKLLFMGEPYKTKQFMRNVLIKLPKPTGMDTNTASLFLKELESKKTELHPAILFHYKKAFSEWVERAGLHPLQKIIVKKTLATFGSDDYDDVSSDDKDDGLNIPYLA